MAWVLFLAAAVLEVGGDASIRTGLRWNRLFFIVLGCLMLSVYGCLVNTVRWDFSKLLGVYVAFFALVSILAGKFMFKEIIPASTWLGLGIVILGGLVIQFGSR